MEIFCGHKVGPQISFPEVNVEIRHCCLSRPGSRRLAVDWSLTSDDGFVDSSDSSAISIGDIGQGSNLEMHTNTVDMFVVGVSERSRPLRASSIMLCKWRN